MTSKMAHQEKPSIESGKSISLGLFIQSNELKPSAVEVEKRISIRFLVSNKLEQLDTKSRTVLHLGSLPNWV